MTSKLKRNNTKKPKLSLKTKSKIGLKNLYESYIKGTEEKANVVILDLRLCNTLKPINKAIRCNGSKIHITTKALKHIYDKHIFTKKVPSEFNLILDNFLNLVKYPNQVFKNLAGKKGDICFVKMIKENKYFCSLEKKRNKKEDIFYIVTAYILKDESYLKKYELVWSWEGGVPPS